MIQKQKTVSWISLKAFSGSETEPFLSRIVRGSETEQIKGEEMEDEKER